MPFEIHYIMTKQGKGTPFLLLQWENVVERFSYGDAEIGEIKSVFPLVVTNTDALRRLSKCSITRKKDFSASGNNFSSTKKNSQFSYDDFSRSSSILRD